MDEGRWIKGNGLTYEDIFAKSEGKLLLIKHYAKYHAPTMFESFL